jgi:hypothetical protein
MCTTVDGAGATEGTFQTQRRRLEGRIAVAVLHHPWAMIPADGRTASIPARRSGVLLPAAVALLGACAAPAVRPPATPPSPPLAVAAQPWGLKQCDAAPLDYPDPADVPRPARVAFTSLPLDPAFLALGVPLVTFRSAELVFHVSPSLPQATVDCTVAAADDAVAWVTRTLALPSVFNGGPARDVFLLDPDTAAAVLERLDPGHRFDVDQVAGHAFVGHPRGREDAYAVFQWKKFSVSYLELGATYAHEWVHMIQHHIHGGRPTEMATVVEGEAGLVGALFQEAVVPGASSLFWERDARALDRVRAMHPELTVDELLNQRPHEHHLEATLFAHMARGVAPSTFVTVRLLAKHERVDYAAAWSRVVGRDLVDAGLSAILKAPRQTPRPRVQAGAPALSIVRNEDTLAFIATGFRPGERAQRSVRVRRWHHDKTELVADSQGVIAWTWPIREGSRYAPREVELRAGSGVWSGTYHRRVP